MQRFKFSFIIWLSSVTTLLRCLHFSTYIISTTQIWIAIWNLFFRENRAFFFLIDNNYSFLLAFYCLSVPLVFVISLPLIKCDPRLVLSRLSSPIINAGYQRNVSLYSLKQCLHFHFLWMQNENLIKSIFLGMFLK